MGVWALDTKGQLAVRREINSTFPEGSHWQFLANIENDPPHTDGHIGFKYVSVGDEVWAVAISGCVCRRCGITENNQLGTGWNIGIAVSNNFFLSISSHNVCINFCLSSGKLATYLCKWTLIIYYV